MENSAIEWTNHTFNPWWGCMKVSEGCKNCYAETLDNRYNKADPHWGKNTPRKSMSESYWQQPHKWNAEAEKIGIQNKVFCASMADVFEAHDSTVVLAGRARLFAMIEETPNLIWQLLTKRPENILDFCPITWRYNGFPENVWIGTSVENQQAANERIPHLLNVEASVHFVSCEPLLGSVDLTKIKATAKQLFQLDVDLEETFCALDIEGESGFANSLDWVIAGGESGHHARPMHPDWARSLRDQCARAGAAFFFKQWGEYKPYHTNPIAESIPLGLFGKAKKIFREGVFIDLPGTMTVNEAMKDFISFKAGKHEAGSVLDGIEYKAFPI